jgi:flagella basal body P-ring formation protein FlgA
MHFTVSLRLLRRGALLVMLLASAVGSWASAVQAGGGGARVKIELPAQVKVQGTMVTLGDVAGITCSSLELLRSLMALPLGRAPHAGEFIRLERDEIARWINRRLGIPADQIGWEGDPFIQISVVTNEINGNTIANFAEAALKDWLMQRSENVRLQVVGVPRDFSLPVGPLKLQTRTFADMEPRKRMSVWVDVYVADIFIRTVSISFEVNAWVQAAVVRQAAPAGAPVAVSDIALHSVEIAALPSSAKFAGIQDTLMGQPFRLRRAVMLGEVLTYAHIEPAPTVARGEWVKIHAVSGAVAVESQGEAVQDGRTGQFIRVKPSKAGGTILARVKGPGLLEIQQ